MRKPPSRAEGSAADAVFPSGAEKGRRCALAGCPLAGRGDARCAHCTGPVVWTDERGATRGRARSCHECAMDGLGLPVCWCACPGPNADFQKDGQRMVTLGGMADMDSFIGRYKAADEARSDAGAAGRGRDAGFVSALLRLDSAGWDAFAGACAAKDARRASAALGGPLGMFRGPGGGWEGSTADRVMGALGPLTGAEWEIVRGVALGASQKAVADAMLVRKQAVSKRMKRLSRRAEWVGRLMEMTRKRQDGGAE